MENILCSASVLCAHPGRLEEELQAFEAAGVDELHCAIMDGLFVPNLGLSFDSIRLAKTCTKLPCNAHLMIVQPERYIQRCVDAGADSITVHVEACLHAHRTLSQIREAGASPGIALNPTTPLIQLEYLLPLVDRVLVLAVEPGVAERRLIPSAFERVKILKENISFHRYKVEIEVAGNVDVTNAAKFHCFGAERFVLGTSALCQGPGTDYRQVMADFRRGVAVQKHLV